MPHHRRVARLRGRLGYYACLLLAGTSSSWAASGTWTNKTDSVWSTTTNWLAGIVADGGDVLADFSTVSGVTTLNVTLDSPRTLGNLKFGGINTLDLLGNNTLTLQNSTNLPTVTGVSQTLRVGAPLASSQQVLFNGGTVSLTNTANSFPAGFIIQNNPFGFTSAGSLGSGTIQIGNAPGGNNAGSSQCGFTYLTADTAGAATPVVLNNDMVIRTIRWIMSQAAIGGLNPQPMVLNGHITLDMGNGNVRDLYPLQPVTITGVLSGGQSGTSVYGLNLNGGSPLTLANAANDFTGNITFVAGNTLGVNSAGALGYYQNRINFNTAGATLRIDAPFTIPNYQGLNGIGLSVAANATINCQTNDLEIDAIIQGTATLTKSGTGKLTLTAVNTFSGPIALSAGTLALTGSGSVNTSSGLTIPTNAVLLLADTASMPNVSSVTVNNGGQFVLQGTPTLKSTLSINVNAGGLLDGSGLSSPLTLGNGQTLSGSGIVNGSVVAAAGSVLVPGTTGTAGTLTFSNDLALNGQSLTFDLRNDTTEGSGTNDEIIVAGNLTLSGGETIYLNYLDGQLAAGTYKLIAYGLSKSGNFTLGAAYPNVTLDNTGTPGYVTLIVSAPSLANNLTWKGDGVGNVWDANTTANWVTNWANPTTVYTDPSKVSFDDNGSNNPAINLVATVLPNAVVFSNNAEAYTISGAGKISGASSLSLKGTNSVTLTTENDFTGGTVFTSKGTLQLGNGGATGAAGSGTISMGSASPKLIVNRTTALTLGTVTGSGGTPQILQNGSGTTTLSSSSDNSFLGAIVNNGMLVLGKASSSSVHALGGATTLNSGGTLQLGGSGGDQIYNGVTLTDAGGSFDLGGQPETITAFSGYGTLTDSIGSGNLTLSASPGLLPQNGTLTMSSGTVTLPVTPGINVIGTFNLNGGTVNSTGNSAANLHGVAAGGTLNVNGGTMTGSGNFYFAIGNTYASSGTAYANFNGGTFSSTGELLVGFQKTAVVTVNPGATLDLNYYSYGDQNSTSYLNGGLIKAAAFNTRATSKTVINYFNGVTAQAKKNADPWINTLTHAYISTNGFTVDDNGYKISVVQGLEHDPALGAALDGGLTKVGSGTLTLKGVNTFTGPITNLAGALQFTTLGGKTSSTFVNDNATNIIQVAAKGTTVTNQSLTLGATGLGTEGLNFNLGSFGLPTAPPLSVATSLSSTGAVSVSIIAPVVPPGQAALVSYGSFDPSLFTNWSVAAIPYVGLSLSNNTANKSIDLVVAQGNYPTWTAAANHTWDTTSTDWKMSLSGTPTNYFETTPPGPPVNFDDSAAGANSHDVQLSAQNVSPAFITISNSLDYLFEGLYGIQGSGALMKNGAGALILSNASGANTYSGVTLVTGGTVVAAQPNVLSAASDTTLSGSGLNLGTNAQNIGNLTLNDSLITGSGTLTGNGGALTLNSSNNWVLATPLAGTIALSKGGVGTLSINNSNSYSGPTYVTAGTLHITDGAALGQGGFSGQTWTIVSSGAALLLDGGFSTSEHVHIIGAGPNGLGCLVVTNGNLTMGLAGAHTALDGDATIYVAGNASLTNLAQYYGGNRLTKSGPGLLYASATLNNLTVSQGTFLGSAQIGTGNVLSDVSVVVNGGATFGGTGTVTPVATLQAGSILTPGMLGIGTLTFNNLVTNAAVCQMEIAKSGTTLSQDQIVAKSNFVFTGSVVVTNLGPDALAAGDSFKLFSLQDYTALNGVVPTLPPLPSGLLWTNRLAVDGSVAVYSTVSTVPTNIVCSLSGTNLVLSWPADHTGWRLLVQTNHLDIGISTNPTDWGVYPGSTNVDTVTIPLDPAKLSEFYRLVYP